ncbi:hypothetical protein H6503_02080 [Candidatus Woesearchaeota archaeon]|nr:hypothetical protein [Candidatus Woesearchaeota archaeon]
MGELEEIKKLLENTLSSMSQNIVSHQQMILQLQKENQELKSMIKERDPLKKEVITSYKRNKRRLIKNKILETIKLKQLSIPEIKDIIVDQHNYCSKASFYRYIEELKQKDYIHITNNTARIKPLVEVV